MASATRLLWLDLSIGAPRALATGDTVDADGAWTFSEDMVVQGDLTVEGTTFTTESETVLISDNNLYLNYDYELNTPTTGGLTVNYYPTATTDSVAATGFVAGVGGVSNPKVYVVGAVAALAASMDTLVLPQDPITVGSTAGFPTSGTIYVTTSAGVEAVTYTGTTGTDFTGTSGGTGTMSTGGLVSTSATALPAVGDLIQIKGAHDASNNGLFEVLSHVGNVLTIRGIGLTGCIEDFTQNQFVADLTVAGSIVKVNVSVIRAGTDGDWEVAKGANSPSPSGLTFTNLATGTGSGTLQTAYVNGNQITTSASEGNVEFLGTEDFTVGGSMDVSFDTTGGISFDADLASNFSVSGAGIDLSLQSAAGRVVVEGGEAAADAVYLNATNAAGGVQIDAGTAGAGTLDVNVGSGGITMDTTGAVTVTGNGIILIDNTDDTTDGETIIRLPTAGSGTYSGSFQLQLSGGTPADTIFSAWYDGSIYIGDGSTLVPTWAPATTNVTIAPTTSIFIQAPTIDITDGVATWGWDGAGNIVAQSYESINIEGKRFDLGFTESMTLAPGKVLELQGNALLIDRAYPLLNYGYILNPAKAGGIVVNYDPDTSVQANVAAPGFVAPDKVTTAGAGFAPGDFILVTGVSSNPANNGLFQIKTYAAGLITIETATADPFVQTAFLTATSAGKVTKVAVSVIRAGTDGLWEVANGATAPLTFVDIATGDVTETLDEAYSNGSTITLDGLSGGTVPITLNGTAGNAGGALDINPGAMLTETNAQIDITWGAGAYTGTMPGIKIDYSGMTSWNNAADVYGINLAGKTNANATGVSGGVYLSSGWDYGVISDADVWVKGSKRIYIGTDTSPTPNVPMFMLWYPGSDLIIQARGTAPAATAGQGIVIESQPGGIGVGGPAGAGGRFFSRGQDGGNASTGGAGGIGGAWSGRAGKGGQASASYGSAAGGAADVTGGTGGAGFTGFNGSAGGSVVLQGGPGGAGVAGQTSGAGATASVLGGNAGAAGGGTQGLGGNATVDAGTGATNGTVSIGATNASTITIGRTGAGLSSLSLQTSSSPIVLQHGTTGGTAVVTLQNTSNTVALFTGTADPSGVVSGAPGSLYLRDNGASSSLYVNTSGSDPGTTWTVLASAAATSLQVAYNNGATIVTAGSVPILFTLTAGDFNVNGAGSVNFGGGTALTTFNLDTTGAITVDSSAAGISLDGVLASNFTVTGAGQDLTLSSVGGSVLVQSTENTTDAIKLDATGVASSVTIAAGTGGLDINTPTIYLDTQTTDIEIKSSETSALTISQGSNIYLTFDTTNSQVVLGQFVDTGTSIGLGRRYANNVGSQIDVGRLVCTDTNSTLQVKYAVGKAGGNLTSRITGVAMANIGTGTSGKINTNHGVVVPVNFSVAVAAGDQGRIAYLGASGQAVLDISTYTSGDYIVEVGIVQGANAGAGTNAAVLFCPRFVSYIP